MRKILFRGKLKRTGHYMYGMPTYDLKRIFNKCHELPDEDYDIIPETLSQFTGVTDKNETKVFENDKVLVHENVCGEIKDWTAKVAFKGGSFCLLNEDGNPICSLFEVCGTFEVIPE